MTLDPLARVFITGGSGYIGRNLIRSLRERGHAVAALARSESSAEVVRSLGAEPVPGSVSDVQALRSGMTGADWLVHAAADTDHGMGTADQSAVNLDGTRNVYAAAHEAGVSRAVHLSTEAVLLDGRPLRNADESTPIPARSGGSYSRTKAESERIALSMSRDGLDVVVIRPRFVWGRDDTTALPQLIDAARTGKLSWIGGGNYAISTTHVANAVEGILRGLAHGRAGEVYFVTDGEPVEFRSFVSQLLETQGVEPPTRTIPRALVIPALRITDTLERWTGGRIRGPMSWQEYATLGVEVTLCIDKARKELGYAPVITREAGIAELSSGDSGA